MAGIWADFPSGSLGLYGSSSARMLDGPWAALDGAFNDSSSGLVPDPDPLIGSAGRVFRFGSSNQRIRLVCGTGVATLGVGLRLWLDEIPSEAEGGGRPHFIQWRTPGSAIIAYAYIDDLGRVAFVNGSSSTAVPTYVAASPSVTANAWFHIESKLTCGIAADASVEIRVNGIPVINETGFTTSSATSAQIVVSPVAAGLSESPDFQIKDLNVWDGTGSQVNDFQGTVSVFYHKPVSDITLGGWTTSYGATATGLLDQMWPRNVFTATDRLDVDGTENIRIGDTYYRPTAGSVDAGTPSGTSANPWLVAQGADTAGDLTNLHAAINASGTPGVTYSTALTAHPTVEATAVTATQIFVRSIDKLTTSYVCTETMTNASWTSGTMSTLSPTDSSYISANDTPPAPATIELADLPPDITSIKFIVPIVRAAKVDGGDGNIQVSLTPEGTNFDVGPNTPITTAFTYWGNPSAPFVSHLNPTTAAPWTPGDFAAGVRMRIDRTV